jgi:DNA replication and repair protein RecF
MSLAAPTPRSAPARQRLAIEGVVLAGFRNYDGLRLISGPEPVVLVGPNGAGKTNLLEALSLLSPGRGLRAAELADLRTISTPGASATSDAWSVAATVRTPFGAVDLATYWQAPSAGTPRQSARRGVRVDGREAPGQAALAQELALIWLTPAMDRLFLEGATGRRRFLDRLVFAFDPAHAGRTLAFERGRRARVRLLAAGRRDDAWLGALERDMAERAVALAAARLDLVARLDVALEQAEAAFPRPRLALRGLIEGWLAEMPALEAEERYRVQLSSDRRRDAERLRCEGPHRSDLAVSYAASGRAAEHCSTGEQKALLIALVLGHARLISRLRGAAPVLLLDEIAAHLDQARRAALFDALAALGCQAWMTGTEAAPFAPLRGVARLFAVRRPGLIEEFARV